MDKIIYLSAKINCDLNHAYRLFTDNQLLESWLSTVAEVEPVVGGKYELFWDHDDRENNSTIGCKVTAVEENGFIAFEWKSPKQFKHFANNADPLTHVVVVFTPNKNGVEVRLLHTGWRNSAEWDEARVWQERAWNIAFDNLKQQINK